MVRMSPSRSNQAADHTVLHLAVSAGEEINSSLPVAAAAAGYDGRDETWATAGSGPRFEPLEPHLKCWFYMVSSSIS